MAKSVKFKRDVYAEAIFGLKEADFSHTTHIIVWMFYWLVYPSENTNTTTQGTTVCLLLMNTLKIVRKLKKQ